MSYVVFNCDNDVKKLDQNTSPTPPKGTGLYRNDFYLPLFASRTYIKDPDVRYTVTRDTTPNPGMQARFNYDNKGFVGTWMGRYSDNTEVMLQSFDPPNMAPSRFYK